MIRAETCGCGAAVGRGYLSLFFISPVSARSDPPPIPTLTIHDARAQQRIRDQSREVRGREQRERANQIEQLRAAWASENRTDGEQRRTATAPVGGKHKHKKRDGESNCEMLKLHIGLFGRNRWQVNCMVTEALLRRSPAAHTHPMRYGNMLRGGTHDPQTYTPLPASR